MLGVGDRLAKVRAMFEPSPGTIYLDAATYGLPPRPTVDAMHQAIADWQAGTANWITAWDMRAEECRTSFAQLIGASADTVSLMPSASVGVGLVAATLQAGDEVLVPDDEFTSVLYPLLVAVRERGVLVEPVPFDDLPRHVRPSTTLVASSLVQSQSGRTADLAGIVRAAKVNGSRILLDATHAVPFVPVAAEIDQIDFLVCAAYKHLLSPRGVAFLAVNREQLEHVPPLFANWRSSSDPYHVYYGGPLDQAAGAARLDVSLAWFAWAGAAVSLGLLVDWQRQGLLAEVVALARRLADNLELPRSVGSVVSVRVEDADAARLALEQRGVKAAVRAGSVRLSPHVYTTAEQIDQASEALAPFVRHPVRR
jgi:selenocysteine lyase/cysteine desulfurase